MWNLARQPNGFRDGRNVKLMPYLWLWLPSSHFPNPPLAAKIGFGNNMKNDNSKIRFRSIRSNPMLLPVRITSGRKLVGGRSHSGRFQCCERMPFQATHAIGGIRVGILFHLFLLASCVLFESSWQVNAFGRVDLPTQSQNPLNPPVGARRPLG